MLFYTACNVFGLCHRHLTDAHQKKTYQNTMRCIEARLRLEREKEQQETLILSVIPAHIGRKRVDLSRPTAKHLSAFSSIEHEVRNVTESERNSKIPSHAITRLRRSAITD